MPVDIAKAVVLKGCKTLDEAREEAVNYECKMDSKLLPDTRHKVRPDNPYGWEKEEFSTNYTCDSRPSRQDGRKHIFEISSQQDDDLNNGTVYPTTAGYSQDLGEYFSYPPDINGYGEIANSDPNEYVYIGQIHQQGTQYPSQNMNHAGVRQNYGQSGNPQRNMGYPNPGRQYQQDPRLFNPYERNGQGNSNGPQPNTMQARKFDPETGRPMQATYRTHLNYGAPPNHQWIRYGPPAGPPIHYGPPRPYGPTPQYGPSVVLPQNANAYPNLVSNALGIEGQYVNPTVGYPNYNNVGYPRVPNTNIPQVSNVTEQKNGQSARPPAQGASQGQKGATVNAIRILQKSHESTGSVLQQTNE